MPIVSTPPVPVPSSLITPPRPADPTAVQVGLERWAEQAARCADEDAATFAREYVADAAGRALLEAVFGNSPFLTQALISDLPFAHRMFTDGYDAAF